MSELEQKKIPSKSWRECNKKVWAVGPPESPKCGCEMKIISFIVERFLVQHNLKDLNLWQENFTKGLSPPEDSLGETSVCDEFDHGRGSYSVPDVSRH